MSKWSKSAENGFVRTITFEGLNLGLPNLAIKCIISRSWMGLYMVEFDPGLQGHLGVIKGHNWQKNRLLHAITFEGFNLGSSNLAIRCVVGSSRIGLYIVEIDLDLQGHLGSYFRPHPLNF